MTSRDLVLPATTPRSQSWTNDQRASSASQPGSTAARGTAATPYPGRGLWLKLRTGRMPDRCKSGVSSLFCFCSLSFVVALSIRYLRMIEFQHELRTPRDAEEWREFHAIRRKVLFENRGKSETYNENHPDDSQAGNHPLVLLYRGDVVGVVRVDVVENVAWLRRVAIRDDLQRNGHGRVLLRLAEDVARSEGCDELWSNAAVEAVDFYERCGYTRDDSVVSPVNSVRVRKSLRGLKPAS